MPQHGKKYKESLSKVDRETLYGIAEAVDLVKSLASAKFDETVELAVRLGVDPRKADQIVRGTLSLPEGTGRTNRVAVFAAGDAAAEARAAGADVVGADDLRAKRDVTVPLIKYGMLASWLLVFLIFVREYSTGIYLLGPGTEVIGSLLVSLWGTGAIDLVSALSVVNVVMIGVGLGVAVRLGVRLHG